MIRDCVSKARLAAEIAKCEALCANSQQRHTNSSKLAQYKLGALTHGPAWRVAENRRNAAFVLDWLRGARCIDGDIADPLVLPFDYRPREVKVKDVGWFVSSGSRLGLLKDELTKCDVRCANCHHQRTARETCSINRGWAPIVNG